VERSETGIPEINWGYPNSSNMDLEFYFSSPLKMKINIEIPELYEFEFEKSKICPHPVAMPALQTVAGHERVQLNPLGV
jgi:hypothetical protein